MCPPSRIIPCFAVIFKLTSGLIFKGFVNSELKPYFEDTIADKLGITVEKAIETDSMLAIRIESAIKDCQVIRSEWTADDGCVVILRLSKEVLRNKGLKIAAD